MSSARKYQRYAWGVLALNLVVILWGALVRATGSGAGCGSQWPFCNGKVLPEVTQLATGIEFTHRISSGLALLGVIGLVFFSRSVFQKGEPTRKAATLSLVFIVIEAGIGAGLVLFELVAEDTSVARAVSIALQLVNTYLLLAALTLTAHWAGSPTPVQQKDALSIWLLVIGGIALILLGMTGAITALGDTLFPPATIGEGLAQDFSPSAHFLIRLRVVHPILAVLVGGYLFFIGGFIQRRAAGSTIRGYQVTLSVLVGIQLMAGLVNILLLAPLWMQLLHLLLADLIWIVYVLFAVTSLSTTAHTQVSATKSEFVAMEA
jgi:heme A synthase